MTTIVNNPPSDNSGGPMGIIIVLIVLAVLGFLGIVYGLPAIQRMQVGVGAPEINVPSEIDINVKQTE